MKIGRASSRSTVRLSAFVPVPIILPVLFLRPRSNSHYQIVFYIVLVVASTIGALSPLLGFAAVEGTVRQIRQRITGIGSYIDVHRKSGSANICDQTAIVNKIKLDSRVVSVAPYISDVAIMEADDDSMVVEVRAVDPNAEAHTSHLADYTTPHVSLTQIENRETSGSQIIAGMGVAKSLHLRIGQAVTLSHTNGDPLLHPPILIDGVVAGIFHTGLSADNSIIVSIDDLSVLANIPTGCITGVSVLTEDIETSE